MFVLFLAVWHVGVGLSRLVVRRAVSVGFERLVFKAMGVGTLVAQLYVVYAAALFVALYVTCLAVDF